jgi:hypothetical protein
MDNIKHNTEEVVFENIFIYSGKELRTYPFILILMFKKYYSIEFFLEINFASKFLIQ